jgi:chromosome segregation ATPase
MFSRDDVDDMFSKIEGYIKQSMDKEIGYYLNMNAVFVQLLLHDAEKQTITLQVETAQIENMSNIENMKEFISNLSNLSLNESGNKSIGKLGSISNTSELIENYETLKHDYDILNEKVNILNNKNEMLSNENNNLNNNIQENNNTINQLRNQIRELVSGGKSNDNNSNFDNLKKLENEYAEMKKKLDKQMEEYQKLVQNYDKKVSESTQFKTLKKLLQDKNTLIVQLKTKVAKYEEK